MKRLPILPILFLLTQIVSAQKENELLPGLTPIVQVFGTANYNVDDGVAGYSFGRAHLGFQYRFNEKWFGKIVIDRGQPTTVGDITVTDTDGNNLMVSNTSSEGSAYTMWLKFASLTWQVNDHLSLEGGALLQNHYITQERFWGMRYVAQTFQDLYWHIPSTDLGFMARYKINETWGLDVAVTNGEGSRKKQDSEGTIKTAVGLDLIPSGKLHTRLYYHHYQAEKSDNENEQMVSAFAGFKSSPKFRIGAEYDYMSNLSQVKNFDSYGFSLFAIYSLNPSTDIFGRFDNFNFDVQENTENNYRPDGNALIAGISHSPVKKVRLSLNYQGFFYDDNIANSNNINLSMEYKF
ncbi:outer membrane beta-barrel protein [Thermophagus sp. OGC60D27]|uniref:outer membrane beta-barrel protein n=1 Tax=Thermophagus sp. OGC60D27 TaxID=3458415 RepID=UPI00403795F2